MKNTHVYLLSLALSLLGLLIFVCKLAFTGLPLLPGEMATAWNVEHQVRFTADGGPVKATVKVLASDLDRAIVQERVVAQQYGQARGRDEHGNRTITLTTRDAEGEQVLYLTALVHKYRGFEEAPLVMRADVAMTDVKVTGAALIAARELLGIAVARSADNRSLVTSLLGLLDANVLRDVLATISGGRSDLRAKVDTAVAVLAVRNIPARRVTGLMLKAGKAKPDFTYQVLSGDTAAPIGNEFLKLSLFGLPLASQNVFRVLMVVPIGILVLVLIRNVVGIKSL